MTAVTVIGCAAVARSNELIIGRTLRDMPIEEALPHLERFAASMRPDPVFAAIEKWNDAYKLFEDDSGEDDERFSELGAAEQAAGWEASQTVPTTAAGALALASMMLRSANPGRSEVDPDDQTDSAYFDLEMRHALRSIRTFLAEGRA